MARGARGAVTGLQWGVGERVVLPRRMAAFGIVQSQVLEGTKDVSGSSVCDYLMSQADLIEVK